MEKRFITHSPSETENLGTSLAASLVAGDVLLLYGDLGAGKTCFVSGIARGLGVKGKVNSPTFTVLHDHAAGSRGLKLHHFDCYRLSGVDEWYGEAFDEMLEDGNVSVIEWPDIIAEALPAKAIRVHINYVPEHTDTREIIVER